MKTLLKALLSVVVETSIGLVIPFVAMVTVVLTYKCMLWASDSIGFLPTIGMIVLVLIGIIKWN
jgi:hypothetical protein